MSDFFEKVFLYNWRVKSYALVVSLTLWIVILGQRTLIVSREIPVVYLVSEEAMVQDSVDKVTVTISAKRSILQNFNLEQAAPEIDLRNLPPGAKRVPIKMESITVPIGAKVLNIEPKVVTLYLKVKTKSIENIDFKENSGEKETD